MRFSTLATAVLAFATLAPAAGAQSLTRADGSTGFQAYPDVKPTEPPATSSFAARTITQNTSQTILTAPGVGVTCPTAPSSVYRRFDLSTFGLATGLAVTSVGFGIESVTAGPSTLNIYRLAGAFTTANLTLVGTADVPLTTADNGTIRNVPITGAFSSSDVLVVEWVQPRANLFFGGNSAGQSAPTYLRAAGCNTAEPTDLAILAPQFATSHWVVNVTGETEPVVGPALSALPGSVAFGATTRVGTTSAAQTVTLTNNGTAATTITSITGSGAPFTVSTTGTSLTLAPGASTTFTVTFAPTNTTAAAGTVTIVSNAPNSPTVVTLTGTGFAPPANDNIADAIALTGTTGTFTGTSVAATKEAAEPAPSCQASFGASVWWKYTPTQAGRLTVDLSATTFDTILTFHQPGTTQIACDDDGAAAPNSLASILTDIQVTAGTPVLIRVAGFGATPASGAISGTFSFVGTTAGEGPAGTSRTFLSATPNPVQGQSAVRFASATATDVTVAVYDVTGRQVATLFQGAVAADQTVEASLDASNLPSGVYVVRATGVDVNLTQRVTVVR